MISRHISSRALLCGLAVAVGCVAGVPVASVAKSKPGKSKPAKSSQGSKVRVLPGGLKVQDLKVGHGAPAVPGKKVTVHYRGTLTNGKQFDASYDRGEPFDFTLGGGQVIKGWDMGVKGMRVGGKRRLVIPAALAYGAQSPSPDIPANSTLVFVVELLKVS